MNALAIIGEYGSRIDALADSFLAQEDSDLYGMLRYFMGYTDEGFKPVPQQVGKRTRPGLLLYIAEAYGAYESALPSALSIELFHNFTLIHDDIEDHDEMRRNRPTLWKLWGINKALNAGDVQLILALRALHESSIGDERVPVEVERFLLAQYQKVIEGQHLDFALAEALLADPLVTEDAYMNMITRKSAELIAAATQAPAIIAKSANDMPALYAFGRSLGIAYQLHDDRQSIWSVAGETGKDVGGDVRERKKTLPVIYARDHLSLQDAQLLVAQYDGGGDIDTATVVRLLDSAGAGAYLDKRIETYKKEAIASLARTSLGEGHRSLLESFVFTLIP